MASRAALGWLAAALRVAPEGEAIVELEVWAEDQRGRTTAPGRAEVMLPSRELGPVQLPPKFASPPPGWHAK